MLEAVAEVAMGGQNWADALDHEVIANLGKYRKYTSSSLRDLLRVIRNKHNHFREMPPALQAKLGPLPEGFVRYCPQCTNPCALQLLSPPAFPLICDHSKSLCVQTYCVYWTLCHAASESNVAWCAAILSWAMLVMVKLYMPIQDLSCCCRAEHSMLPAGTSQPDFRFCCK